MQRKLKPKMVKIYCFKILHKPLAAPVVIVCTAGEDQKGMEPPPYCGGGGGGKCSWKGSPQQTGLRS